MELAVTEDAIQTTRTSKCFRTAKPSSPSSSPSASASMWGLSGRVGMRVLMHRDLITCRFFRSLPRSWLKKYWGQLGQKSNKRPFGSLSSSSHRWSSPFSLSSVRSLSSPVSRLSSPALKDRDREWDQAGSASSQNLDGHPCFLSTPGMTIGQWGPSTQLTATHTSCSTASPASSLGHSLYHHNGSGWVSLPSKLLLFHTRVLYLVHFWKDHTWVTGFSLTGSWEANWAIFLSNL